MVFLVFFVNKVTAYVSAFMCQKLLTPLFRQMNAYTKCIWDLFKLNWLRLRLALGLSKFCSFKPNINSSLAIFTNVAFK